MTKNLSERVATLEAEVAALQGILLSFMVATRRAESFAATAAIELAEAFGDDAEEAGQRAIATETRHLLDALARMHEGSKDADARD
ncbi:hypothetical protein [Novosphingobium sp.]|uniref:hypothetical protein n=1 Tax=Novosphingobium sp. TaxID=1874826 RepID=UPI0026269717|nr:hypothetical protein [Novosphingobium sp.]